MLTLYSKAGCTNCTKVVNLFSSIKLEYKLTKLNSINQLVSLLEYQDYDISELTSFPVLTDGNQVYTYPSILMMYSEPLLTENQNRFTMYPIQYSDIYDMYKKARASYWQPEEISLSKDLQDWEVLTSNEKHFVTHVLAFFAASDGIVNENINVNFAHEVQIPEARAFYAFQEAMEAVHSETYSILLDTYVQDLNEKKHLQNAITTIDSIKDKAAWCVKWMNKTESFAKRIFAFACVEGIYFSGSFCAIYWLKKRNLLPGLSFSNELISRDEGLHTDFALLLYSKLKNKLDENTVHTLVDEAVVNEKKFIIESLPCKLIGMNSDLMKQYIEYVADHLLVKAGYSKLYFSTFPEHIS